MAASGKEKLFDFTTKVSLGIDIIQNPGYINYVSASWEVDKVPLPGA